METPAWDQMSIDTQCSYCQCLACRCLHHDNGEIPWSFENKLFWFWIYNILSISFFCVIEILLLMIFGVRYCVRVAWALDQRLVPLNKDRAFVADSLIRAAFELGNPTSMTLGVDPQKDHQDTNAKLLLLARLLMYKLKCVGTAAVIKQIVSRTTSVEFSTYAKPWLGTVLATVFWDGLIAHVIINQAQLRGIGVYTSVEVFNELMDTFFPDKGGGVDAISTFAKIQICRAVGVAIIKHGSMFPTMELLLRHAIQYLGLRGKRVVCEAGTLDNEDAFLRGLVPDQELSSLARDGMQKTYKGLTQDEVRVALCVLLLSFVLDGDLGTTEMELWQLACDAAGPETAVFDPGAVKALCVHFRGIKPVAVMDLLHVFDPSKTHTAEQKAPMDVRVREFFHDVEACLAI